MAVVGEIEIKTKIDNSEVDEGIEEIKDKSNNLNELDERIAKAKAKEAEEQERIKELQEQTAESQKKTLEYQEQIAEAQQALEMKQQLQQQIQNAENSMKNIGKSIENNIKSVKKWVLALFGVSGVFSFIRSSMSTISQYDKQLGADIQYMKNALAFAIEPIVRLIVDLMKKLIVYTQYIVYQWTGKNIFENANKSLQGANKQAKDLKKQLAGFDEMNVLSDNSSSGGGATAPSIDLSNMEDFKAPKWLDDIVAFGRWVIENWKEVVFTLLMIKVFIDILTGNWVAVVIDLIGLLILGFMLIWDEVKKIIDNLVIIWNDLCNDIVSAVKIAWDFAIAILSIIGTWIYSHVIKPIADFFVGLWNGIIDGVKLAIQWVKDVFNGLVKFFSGIIKTILGFFKTIGTAVGDVVGGTFKTVINGVLSAIENILNSPIKAINKLLGVVNKISPIKIETLSTFKLPRLAKGTIVSSPGKGVLTPMGTALYGEAGREAYLPLSDTQLLEELGSTIGKYININATVPVYVGNRQIAREIRKINAEDDFAFNG